MSKQRENPGTGQSTRERVQELYGPPERKYRNCTANQREYRNCTLNQREYRNSTANQREYRICPGAVPPIRERSIKMSVNKKIAIQCRAIWERS
jgi:hypothetical protein